MYVLCRCELIALAPLLYSTYSVVYHNVLDHMLLCYNVMIFYIILYYDMLLIIVCYVIVYDLLLPCTTPYYVVHAPVVTKSGGIRGKEILPPTTRPSFECYSPQPAAVACFPLLLELARRRGQSQNPIHFLIRHVGFTMVYHMTLCI